MRAGGRRSSDCGVVWLLVVAAVVAWAGCLAAPAYVRAAGLVVWGPTTGLGSTTEKYPTLTISAPSSSVGAIAFQSGLATAALVPVAPAGFGPTSVLRLGPVPLAPGAHPLLTGVAVAGSSTAVVVAGAHATTFSQVSPALGAALGVPQPFGPPLARYASPPTPAPLRATVSGDAVGALSAGDRSLRVRTLLPGAASFGPVSRSLGVISCDVHSAPAPLALDDAGNAFTAALSGRRSCLPDRRLSAEEVAPDGTVRRVGGRRIRCGTKCTFALGAGGHGDLAVLTADRPGGHPRLRLQTGTAAGLGAAQVVTRSLQLPGLFLDEPRISSSGEVTLAWETPFRDSGITQTIEAARAHVGGRVERPVQLFESQSQNGGARLGTAPGVVMVNGDLGSDTFAPVRAYVATGRRGFHRQLIAPQGALAILRGDDSGDDLIVWMQADTSLWASVRPAGADTFGAPHEVAPALGVLADHFAAAVPPGGRGLIAWVNSTGQVSAASVQLGVGR